VFRWDSGGLVLGGICEYMCQHAPISGDMSYHNLKYLQINWGGGGGRAAAASQNHVGCPPNTRDTFNQIKKPHRECRL
jgi:hypothetical protein